MNNGNIMILGTFHFMTDEGRNIIKVQDENRQMELSELIKKISKFKPNKLCVELRPSEEEKYNKIFHEFLDKTELDLNKRLQETGIKGADYNITNSMDERIKFAFDLAKYNNINHIHCIDYFDEWNQQAVFEKAKEDTEIYMKLEESYMKFANLYYSMFTEETSIEKIYRVLNNKETNDFQHSTSFLPFNEIGIGSDSVGVDFVASWYKRNLHILSNLKSISKDEDRILILYGAGHLKLLRDFINDSLDLNYIEALEYLI